MGSIQGTSNSFDNFTMQTIWKPKLIDVILCYVILLFSRYLKNRTDSWTIMFTLADQKLNLTFCRYVILPRNKTNTQVPGEIVALPSLN